MDAEYFVVYDCSKGEVVEDLCAIAPHIYGPIFPQALVIEAIYLGDLSTLVISSYQKDALRVSYLISLLRV